MPSTRKEGTRRFSSAGRRRPQHDVKWSSKCVFVMCGLPGRGKSHIGSKIISFLTWRGLKCRLFNVGKARREEYSDDTQQTARFFDHSDQAATRKREQIAYAVLDELLDWLEWEGGSVAVFDATNTTARRRMNVYKRVHQRSPKLPVVFVESICDDEEVLLSNYLVKCTYSPDYKDMPLNEALADLKARIENYARVYQTVDNDQLSYIKLFNLATKVICNRVHGEIPILIAAYLMSVHIRKRPIYLTRAGEPSSSTKYARSFRARTRGRRPAGRSRSEADVNSTGPPGDPMDQEIRNEARITSVPEYGSLLASESGQQDLETLSTATDASFEVPRSGLVRVDTSGSLADDTDIIPLADFESKPEDLQQGEEEEENAEVEDAGEVEGASSDDADTDPVLAEVAKISAARRRAASKRPVAEFSNAAPHHRVPAGHARRPQTHLKSMIAPLSERGEQYALRLAAFIRGKSILYQKRVALEEKNRSAARRSKSRQKSSRSDSGRPSAPSPQQPSRTPRNASPGKHRLAAGSRASTSSGGSKDPNSLPLGEMGYGEEGEEDPEAGEEERDTEFEDCMERDLEPPPERSPGGPEAEEQKEPFREEGSRTPQAPRGQSRSTSPPQPSEDPTFPLSSPQSPGGIPATTPIGNRTARSSGRLPVAIYCSTLPRAEQTVAHIPADVMLHSCLNSFNTGVFHGMTTEEILSTSAGREQHKFFLKNPYTYRYPGGDSLRDVALSMESLVMDIERHTSPCLVISHSNTLKVLYSYFLGPSVDPKDIHKLDIPPHTVIELIPALYGYVERRYSLNSDEELEEHLASIQREEEELEQEQAKRLRIQELLHKHPLTSDRDRDFLRSIQGLHVSAGSADVIERLQNQLKSLAGHEHEDLLPSPRTSAGETKHGTQFYE